MKPKQFMCIINNNYKHGSDLFSTDCSRYVLKQDQLQHTHTINTTIMFNNKLDSIHYDYYYTRLPI